MSIIEYCDGIAQPPLHLNLDFFEELTENAIRETNLRLEHIKFTMGSSVGENYCSQIFRAKVQFKRLDNDVAKNANGNTDATETLSVIVKSMPHSEASEFLQDLKVYLKEKITYYDVLPRMQLFLETGQTFAARLYHSLKLPINTLVFEDLGACGYEMASREKGLDEAHCKLVMRRLAQFHAVSMVLAQKDPEIMKCYDSGMLARAGLDNQSGMLLRYFGGSARTMADLVRKWQGYESIAMKLDNYVVNLRDNLVQAQEPLPGEIKVLNHGDLWVNNILFQYDKQNAPQDLRFIDFQLTIWGSPGIDLNYFFYTSMQLDILKSKREQLLHVYHEELCANLERLNYANVPSYAQIREEVRRRESYGFFANYTIFPTISLDKESSQDNHLENFLDEDFVRQKNIQMFESKRLQETLRYTLKHFDEVGIWD